MSNSQELGYIESSQRLVHQSEREWNPIELLRAAEGGELRNTGWPIGLVIRAEGLKPVPTPEGIEARLAHRGQEWQDYWMFDKDGSYYVVRLFEENFEPPTFTSSRHRRLSQKNLRV